jgi:hypothetical protein
MARPVRSSAWAHSTSRVASANSEPNANTIGANTNTATRAVNASAVSPDEVVAPTRRANKRYSGHVTIATITAHAIGSMKCRRIQSASSAKGSAQSHA